MGVERKLRCRQSWHSIRFISDEIFPSMKRFFVLDVHSIMWFHRNLVCARVVGKAMVLGDHGCSSFPHQRCGFSELSCTQIFFADIAFRRKLSALLPNVEHRCPTYSLTLMRYFLV